MYRGRSEINYPDSIGLLRMKSSFKPLKYLGLAILIFITWHLHPKLSHICHEEICSVITSAKNGFYWSYTSECIECPPIGTGFRLSWFINHEEEREEGKELFKVTHCQARAPPVWEG